MRKYIDKAAVVAEIKRLSAYLDSLHEQRIIEKILSFLDTLEVKEVDYVKINRKVLFEMCDAILNHDGYADRDDCPENDFPYFVGWWDSDFRKKVENIRNNS